MSLFSQHKVQAIGFLPKLLTQQISTYLGTEVALAPVRKSMNSPTSLWWEILPLSRDWDWGQTKGETVHCIA